MKLLFTGDINFRGLSEPNSKMCSDILAEILPYFEKADFRIVNLETPLADKENHLPIKKSGPNLICDPKNIMFLETLHTDVCTLANNHTGDFGEDAVIDTLKLLDTYSIRYCGAGANIDRAYDACRLEKDGFSISLISVCENEFGVATEATYGSAGYNARRLMNKIKQEKKVSDAVIVVFHGGNEFNPLPSPDTQDRYRLICDMGADAVVAGHTHCPQGYEVYDGKPIVYSMGNFLFKSSSERSANDSWYYGYMTELDIDESGIVFCTIPYKFNSEATRITVFEGDEKRRMLRYIDSLSEIIKDPKLLDNYFSGWAYLHKWVTQAPANYFDLKEYNSSGNYNLISCESHLSQAKKVLEFCFLDRVAEAKEWSEKVAELTRMPV